MPQGELLEEGCSRASALTSELNISALGPGIGQALEQIGLRTGAGELIAWRGTRRIEGQGLRVREPEPIEE